MDDSLSSLSSSPARGSAKSPLAQKLFHQTNDALQRVKELRSLQSGTKNVTKYISQLQSKITETNAQLADKDRELAAAQRDVAAAHKRLADLERSLEEANDKIEQVNKKSFEAAFSAKEQLNRSTRKSSDLKRQLREANQDIEMYRTQLHDKQTAADALAVELDGLDNELKQLRAQQASALRSKDREAATLRDSLNESQAKNRALQAQISSLTESIENANQELEQERQQHAARLTEEAEKTRQVKANLTAKLQVCQR